VFSALGSPCSNSGDVVFVHSGLFVDYLLVLIEDIMLSVDRDG